MRMYDIINKKRRCEALSDEEIRYFVDKYTNGQIPDYQASALMMAICINSMNVRETETLTDAMMRSGDMLDLSEFGDLSVDKHSTGGVGDKTTLVVAPIVACLGGKIAKMSGRGLGHTGGTIDKLESIPGFRTELSPSEFIGQVRNIGIAVISQSGNLAPADKKLYALRDVSATVESIPLIASSIMSKKLAAGAKSLVLDVKVGSGAFMKYSESACELAQRMITVGKACGKNVRALITNMDLPLGRAVGNSLEVAEAAEVLKGKGSDDLRELCFTLAANMLSMCLSLETEESMIKVKEAVESGKAYAKFREWIAAQGADERYADDISLLPHAPIQYEVKSVRDGYIGKMNAENIGLCATVLGAGRQNKTDKIDYGAGIILCAKTGDKVRSGDTLAVFYTSDSSRIVEAKERYFNSIEFTDEKPNGQPLIFDTV